MISELVRVSKTVNNGHCIQLNNDKLPHIYNFQLGLA